MLHYLNRFLGGYTPGVQLDTPRCQSDPNPWITSPPESPVSISQVLRFPCQDDEENSAVTNSEEHTDTETPDRREDIILPENMYSAVICIVLQSAVLGPRCSLEFNVVAFPIFAGAVLSWAAQLWMIWSIQETNWSSEMCTVRMNILRVVCMGVFHAVMLTEMKQTLMMHYWLQQIPNSVTTEPLKIVKKKATTGMSRAMRVAIYMLLLAPKAIVAIFLLHAGSGHMLKSDRMEDLILNAVSLVFIIEVDEVMYKYILSEVWRQSLSFKAGKCLSQPKSMCFHFIFPYLALIVLCICVLFECSLWCGWGAKSMKLS